MCIMAIGAVLGAASSIMSGVMQANAQEAQAAVYERQAEIEADKGRYEAGMEQDRVKKMVGENRAAALASGLALSGSPADVILDNTTEGEMDVQAIKYGAEIKSSNYKMQAGIARMRAGQAMAGGVIGALSPLIRGGRTFFKGGAFRDRAVNAYA